MRVTTTVFGSVAAFGLTITLFSGYRVVNGPFLDGTSAEGTALLLSLAGFLVGIVVFAWGLTRAAGIGARM